MLTLRFTAWLLSVGVIVWGVGAVSAQTTYPTKPIRIITSSVASSSDFAARLIAQGVASSLGQTIVVDNRSGITANEAVANAPPDGYTLLVVGSNFWIGPLLVKTPYDPVRDFAPITLVAKVPHILAVHPSVPAKSIKELIALAKARPGELNYATGSTGGSGHLAGALFNYMAGINVVRVAYKGGGQALNDLVSGQVQLAFGSKSEVLPHVQSGKLRALGVTTAEPSALVPGLPPIATGLPGYESVPMQGVFAPAKTPEAVINRLNQEMVRCLSTPDAKERFLNTGAEPAGSSPEQLAATIRSEIARLGKLIKDAGIKAD